MQTYTRIPIQGCLILQRLLPSPAAAAKFQRIPEKHPFQIIMRMKCKSWNFFPARFFKDFRSVGDRTFTSRHRATRKRMTKWKSGPKMRQKKQFWPPEISTWTRLPAVVQKHRHEHCEIYSPPPKMWRVLWRKIPNTKWIQILAKKTTMMRASKDSLVHYFGKSLEIFSTPM